MLEDNNSTCVAVEFNSSQNVSFFFFWWIYSFCKRLTVQVFSLLLYGVGFVFQKDFKSA